MDITQGFSPESLGDIVALHERYYAKHWGFGTFFEAKVAREMGEFQARLSDTDLVLIALDDTGLAASLILDLHDPASGARGAHLRWFIAASRCRGSGIGRQLLVRAMEHADKHTHGRAWLTTFAGLAPARHLYEAFGFQLAAEKRGDAWGTEVTEQEFRRASCLP